MNEYTDWSTGWIREGDNISYTIEGITYYERVVSRDLAHYEWPWGGTETHSATPVTIGAEASSGPYIPGAIEMTKGYDSDHNTNQIWQAIFGIKGQALIYIELPTDTKRHGLPKLTWPTNDFKPIAHFDENMSPFLEPTFITEHFFKYRETHQIEFDAYNPHSIDLTDVWLNFFINKMVTERIGKSFASNGDITYAATYPHFEELMKKLYQRLVPCRPISILPVQAPAVAGAGE